MKRHPSSHHTVKTKSTMMQSMTKLLRQPPQEIKMPTDIKHRIYSRKRHGKPERTNYLQYLELWNQNMENFTFLTARKLGNWKNKTCSLKYSPTNHIEESTESAPLQWQSISTQLFFVSISWNRSRLDQIDHHKHHISTNTSTRKNRKHKSVHKPVHKPVHSHFVSTCF